MRFPIVIVAAVSLVVAACSPTPSDTDVTTTDGVSSTTATSPAPAPERFVVGTADGGVAVYPGVEAQPIPIDQPSGTRARQPVWLADGSILFATADSSGNAGLTAADSATGDPIWSVGLTSRPFYYLPSPPGAERAATSLRNDPGGEGMIAELVGRDGSIEEISRMSPYYATWSPDGSSLATHVEQSTLSVRDEAGSRIIAEPAGAFQAPAWVGEGLVTLRTTGTEQLLSVWNEGAFRDVATVDGPVRFVVGGGKVALQAVPSEDDTGGVQASQRTQTLPSIPAGRLVVIDLATGSIDSVTSVLTPLFQWDPGGSRLLYATFDTGTTLDLTWHIWSDGEVSDFPSFVAQPQWFRDVVPFFDQYDQSVSLWAGSGASFAYPAVVDDAPVVVVQPTEGGDPTIVADAIWVAWDRRSS